MPKSDPQPAVLVLGGHPSAYLAAALLRAKGKVRVLHATIPGEPIHERLVLINPQLFELHSLLENLPRRIDLCPTYGLCFLADDPAARSEFRDRHVTAHVAAMEAVRSAMRALAEDQGVDLTEPKTLQIHRLDEKGLEVTLGKTAVNPKALVLAGRLPAQQERLLGLPESWGADLVHRYTFVKLHSARPIDLGRHATIPMSLDLGGTLAWAWLLPGPGRQVQLAVQAPLAATGRPKAEARALLHRWVQVLQGHGVLKAEDEARFEEDAVQWLDVPLAGALAHEGVANRTLLIGPAGGFYSASGEEIYPACWSAIYAADTVRKALREPHLQDALQPYRHRWRTTLGDYLRGPQQNLRFLLPLVYRNQAMADRLAESILMGKSVVR